MKDLPDIALLATTGSFSAADLRAAIEATFAFRKTHAVPATLPPPPARWQAVYARMALSDQLPWADLEAVLAASRAFLDPILEGRGGIWNATSWAWE